MKSVAVYTSTRADFGLLKPLIEKLIVLNTIEVRIFVTGTHLDTAYGSTVREIEQFFSKEIYYRVPHLMKEDPTLKNLLIMSQAIEKYGQALALDAPDMAIILGDRYEALCFGLVCASLAIPIAHLHGGELTLGAIDDKFRHCLTKLSNWHFVACESYRRRVIQLGEAPETVFNVGALGVDNALNQKVMTAAQLEIDLGISLQDRDEVYLFTYHPETNSKDHGAEILKAFLKSLGQRLTSKNALVVITGVNSDPGAQVIKEILNQFCVDYSKQVFFKESLGLIRYLSVMKLATGVLGNSSSGILEAFSMKAPSVNIGSRQQGREREKYVFDLTSAEQCLNFNFEKLVNAKAEMLSAVNQKSVFGTGQTSATVAEQIQRALQSHNPIPVIKEFYDL